MSRMIPKAHWVQESMRRRVNVQLTDIERGDDIPDVTDVENVVEDPQEDNHGGDQTQDEGENSITDWAKEVSTTDSDRETESLG